VHISGSIWPITLIWASLERCFPPAEVEYRLCQFWSKGMMSEVDGTGRMGVDGLNSVARFHCPSNMWYFGCLGLILLSVSC